ncbi:hypothetical protein MRX96_049683 [Rhipicephalus microplus]
MDYEKVKKTLELGPKLYFEHHLKEADALEMGRMVADRVPEAEKACCIAECAGVIATARQKTPMLVREFVANTRDLVDYFVDRKIRHLVADKKGTFPLLLEGLFQAKAEATVNKHLKAFEERLRDVKKKAVALLQEMKLDSLCSAVRKVKGTMLETFCPVKTHKAFF